jgi:exodeoxyribonuclease-3
MKTILSWNVNGIRAVDHKGFLPWLKDCGADIVCLQETKIQPDKLTAELAAPDGYTSYWRSALRKGYSGVAIYTREKPVGVRDLGIAEFDDEGRVQVLEYPAFTLINAYFPNSREEGARLDYKIRFCDEILDFTSGLAAGGKDLVICGDYNIAHKAIDLANPKANEKNPGYLPEERAWMEKFTTSGFTDTFRMFNREPAQYSWWSYRFKAREKNIGWRIDYHCVNDRFRPKVKAAGIMQEVMGSDHCPVSITLDIE